MFSSTSDPFHSLDAQAATLRANMLRQHRFLEITLTPEGAHRRDTVWEDLPETEQLAWRQAVISSNAFADHLASDWADWWLGKQEPVAPLVAPPVDRILERFRMLKENQIDRYEVKLEKVADVKVKVFFKDSAYPLQRARVLTEPQKEIEQVRAVGSRIVVVGA